MNIGAMKTIRLIIAISLVLFPVLLMMNFLLVVEDWTELAIVRMDFSENDASNTQEETDPFVYQSAEYQWRYSTLPDTLGLVAMIPVLFVGAYLGYLAFKAKPWLTIVGECLFAVGSVFMIALYGASLMHYALRVLPLAKGESPYPPLEGLIGTNNLFQAFEILAMLCIVGLIILVIGVYLSKHLKLWAAIVEVVGCSMQIVFFDVRGLQTIGGLLILIGLLPLVIELLKWDNLTTGNIS